MLKEGDSIPDFCLRGVNEKGEEKEFCTRDLKGKKLVIYFYPKDNTPGCTTEACDFRDNMSILTEYGYQVIGISPDSINSHKKFKEKYHLNFVLLSDPQKKVAKLFGAYGEKKRGGKITEGIIRSTFLINEKGRVEKVWHNVKAKGHVRQILKSLKILKDESAK